MASEQTQLTEEERKSLAQRGYADPVWFCQHFLPHLFPGRVPWVHKGLLAILTGHADFLGKLPLEEQKKIAENFTWVDDQKQERRVFRRNEVTARLEMTLGRYTIVMLPRGFSKTTIAGIAVPLMEILYQDVPFMAYVSETSTHAKMQLHNIQREIQSNGRIKAVFGDLKPAAQDPEKWAEGMFETKTGVALLARGRGSQVRGMLHRGQRPSKIVCDDLEDKESVKTKEQRKKTLEWFTGDLKPALPKLNPDATIVCLGTLLHGDALLEKLKGDPEWTAVTFGAVDKDGDPLWPENMTLPELEAEKSSFARLGQLNTYYLEYFNQVRNDETAHFKQHWFQYGPPKDLIAVAVVIDPAISKNRTADDCVVAAVGMARRGQIFVLDMWGKQGAKLSEMADVYFMFSMAYAARYHGCESNAFQAALIDYFKQEMFRRKHYFEITPITQKIRKPERIIGGLQGRYASGYITHCRKFEKLEVQLLDYDPEVEQHDDYPDTLAMGVKLLDPVSAHTSPDDLETQGYEELEVGFGEWAS